jgi:hypothetical protein
VTESDFITLHIVFEPKHAAPEKIFIEVETEEGKSVSVGEWIPDPYMSGYEVLKLRVAAQDIHSVNE